MSGPARTTNVVLVHGAWADGSSWNDAVIGADTNETVRSLVFIAASAPDEGETVAEVFYRDKPNPQAPQLIPDAHGLIWMPREGFGPLSRNMHRSSGPRCLLRHRGGSRSRAIQEKAPRPAWRVKPSWYLLAEEDRMISPATQLFMARRMGARIRSEKIDHTPLVTAPAPVIDTILEPAASATV